MNRVSYRLSGARSAKVLALCLTAALPAFLATAAHAQSTLSFTVLGSANPFLAGMPDGSTASGDTAPGQSPTQVTGFNLTGGGMLTFSVTGSVDFGGGAPGDPADGSFDVVKGAENGISGYNAPANALIGVFLNDDQPDGSAAPGDLDFSAGGLGQSFSSLSPGLKQTFFIGDGLTGNGTGSTQTFNIPTGATRFYLGTVDGSGWFNNSGSFQVNVTGPGATAPEPGTLSLLGLTALPLAAGVLRRRRSSHQ
ncbi:MAG: PEP-CTERM sorting domain-containing protein [Armatimonas sp.]